MGLQLDRNRYTVAFGNSTTLRATLREGTDVVFDWDMGDGALYKDTGECDLLPSFSSRPGCSLSCYTRRLLSITSVLIKSMGKPWYMGSGKETLQSDLMV